MKTVGQIIGRILYIIAIIFLAPFKAINFFTGKIYYGIDKRGPVLAGMAIGGAVATMGVIVQLLFLWPDRPYKDTFIRHYNILWGIGLTLLGIVLILLLYCIFRILLPALFYITCSHALLFRLCTYKLRCIGRPKGYKYPKLNTANMPKQLKKSYKKDSLEKIIYHTKPYIPYKCGCHKPNDRFCIYPAYKLDEIPMVENY